VLVHAVKPTFTQFFPSDFPANPVTFFNFYFCLFCWLNRIISCLLSSGSVQGVYRPLLGPRWLFVHNRRNLVKVNHSDVRCARAMEDSTPFTLVKLTNSNV
jgi:hypothetical protein